MWGFGLQFKFMWSLLLFLIYIKKDAQAINSNPNSNEVPDLDWMQTGKLGLLDGGLWLRPAFCPDGSFVTGYQMKYGQGNATGEITGLKLVCSKLDENYELQTTRYLLANGPSKWISSSNSISVSANQQAVGFSMARWTDSQDFEFVGGRRLKFYGEDGSEKYRFKFPRRTNSTLLVSLGCPENWAVCGMQAREKGAEYAEDEPILTQLRFKCCYYCIPQERRVILDDYTNPGSTDYHRTIRQTVGTQFDRRRSTSGSTSEGTDWTKETQNTNSKNIGISASENVGSTNSSGSGLTDSKGWNTGEELRISTSNQKGETFQISDGTSTSESDSRSVGKSKSQTDSNNWSKTKGTSSSHTAEASLEVKACAGFNAFGAKAEVAVTARGGYSYNTAQHQDETEGGSSSTAVGTTEDKTRISGSGTNREVSRGTSNTDTTGQDNSASTGAHGGTSSNREESRQRSIQKAKERSIQEGAQAMFTQRQSGQTTWAFNWEQTDTSMWREEREDTYSFTCEAMQRCKIEQVYGTCGALRFGTTKIEKKIEVLNYGIHGGSPEPEVGSEDPNKTKEIQWDIKIPGETWVVVKDFSHWEPSGLWEDVQICPPETIVTGHSFKTVLRAGFTGITLYCSGKYGPDEGAKEHNSTNVNVLRISSGDGAGRNRTRGHWGFNKRGTRSNFAEGYSFVRREMNGRRWIGNQEIIYHNITLMNIPFSFAVNSSRVVTKCPQDHAICGLTAMMDKFGRGILTAFGFKCCHHCIPEENWVTVHDYTNRGSSEEKKEVTTTVGLTTSQTNVSSNSVNSGSTIDSAGLHKGFSARFGKSSSTGFDWVHTKNAIWSTETSVREFYVCEPYSFCQYRRLVGQCGSVRVPVDKFEKISKRLPEYGPDPNLPPAPSTTLSRETTTPSNPSGSGGSSSLEPRVYPNQYNLEDELTPVQLVKNKEIWIEAQNIQSSGQNTNSIWGTSESCPLGSFVTGYKLKTLGGEDENTKELLTGLELECSRWDAQGNFQPVKMIPGGQRSSSGRPGQSGFSSDADPDLIQTGKPAVGFHLFLYEWYDAEDGEFLGQDTTGHSLMFDRWSTPEPPVFTNPDYEMKVVPEKIVCPADYVICGVQTKKDRGTGVLTDIRFRCCYHCEPSETEQDLDYQENLNDENEKHTIEHVSVGANVEVGNPIVEGSSPNSFTLLQGFSDHLYIKEMFSNRLSQTPGSKEPGQPKVNWSRQPKNTWTREVQIKKDYTCKAQHTCQVVQIVGVCGKLQIPTSVTSNQYAPI